MPVKTIIHTVMSGNVTGWGAGVESCRSQEDFHCSFGPSECTRRLHSARRINEERTRENAMHPAVGSECGICLGGRSGGGGNVSRRVGIDGARRTYTSERTSKGCASSYSMFMV